MFDLIVRLLAFSYCYKILANTRLFDLLINLFSGLANSLVLKNLVKTILSAPKRRSLATKAEQGHRTDRKLRQHLALITCKLFLIILVPRLTLLSTIFLCLLCISYESILYIGVVLFICKSMYDGVAGVLNDLIDYLGVCCKDVDWSDCLSKSVSVYQVLNKSKGNSLPVSSSNYDSCSGSETTYPKDLHLTRPAETVEEDLKRTNKTMQQQKRDEMIRRQFAKSVRDMPTIPEPSSTSIVADVEMIERAKARLQTEEDSTKASQPASPKDAPEKQARVDLSIRQVQQGELTNLFKNCIDEQVVPEAANVPTEEDGIITDWSWSSEDERQ